MMKRLIVISNRLPVQFVEKEDGVEMLPSSGGLVSSVKSYLQKNNADAANNRFDEVLWLGSADIPEDKFRKSYGSSELREEEFVLKPVFIPDNVYDLHYNGFCNGALWPLFHYFPSYAIFKDESYESYQQVNQLFAEELARIYQPGDTCWVHDYHLMLLPRMLRKSLGESASIGFFLHIPFPSFELFRLIPTAWRKEILDGLLGADLIGFHTSDYLQYFIKSVRQLMGYENTLRVIRTRKRSVMADVFPVSIDFEKFHLAVTDPLVRQERDTIRQIKDGLKTLTSVDRLDYSKAIVNRLESFRFFLEKYPQYREKVSYLMVIIPSRTDIPQYKENKKKIEELVGAINGKYGTLSWTPVIYQYRSLDFRELTGLYLATDVALITPVRDGMNLVAKEFVSTWNDGKGALIISETAGAASELAEALVVNPTDLRQIADSLEQALNMPPEEQVSRNREMQKRLSQYNVVKWAEDFIGTLELSKKMQQELNIQQISEAARADIVQHYAKATSRILFFDYDGTLTPIVKRPELAAPGKELLEMLAEMASDPRNTLVLVSGRPTSTLDAWFGDIPLEMVAEHGAFVKRKGGEWESQLREPPAWKQKVRSIMEKCAERCAGSFVEEKTHSLAWHYRNSETGLGFIRSRELIDRLTELSHDMDFHLLEGHKVIEVRSRGIDKGTAAGIWFREKEYDFRLAIGDDRTDEDLFKAIPAGGYTIRVGLVPSAARFSLSGQADVTELLQKLPAVSNTVFPNN